MQKYKLVLFLIVFLLANTLMSVNSASSDDATCGKGWEMNGGECKPCDDICKARISEHYVYDPDKSSANNCECKCEDGYKLTYQRDPLGGGRWSATCKKITEGPEEENCDDYCKDPSNSGTNADHAIWDGTSVYPDCYCECEKDWTMKEQGCVSCEDSCQQKGSHFVYDPDKSYTNICECKCEDGYESGWDDSGNEICKKVACPENSTNVTDLPAGLPSDDRKLSNDCYCDEGYIKSFEECVVEEPSGDELYYITPAYQEIVVGESIQFFLKKKLEGSYETETISNDLIEWKTMSCSSDILAGQVIGEIDKNGLFTSSTIGTCKIVARMDGINYITEVTVKCSENEPGNLDEILRLYKARIPSGIVLSYPNDPRYYVDSVGPGRANNIYSWVYDEYKPFTCGGYQGQVLRFVHEIQHKPDECTLLNNYEFGPIEGACGMHHAVVIYPAGADWKTEGIVLDPWPSQTPQWEHITVWEKKFYPAAGETFILGEAYPTQSSDASTTADYCNRGDDAWIGAMDKFGELYDDPVGSIRSGAGTGGQLVRDFIGGLLPCPVDLLITDSEGRRMGLLANGSMTHEIPYSFILNNPESETENSWYFELNTKTTNHYNLELTGTDDGTFKFLWVSPKDRIIREYGEQSIKKGEIATVTIDLENPETPLIMPDGSEILPTIIDSTSFPAPSKTGLTFESRSRPHGSEVQIPLTMKDVSETIGNMDLTLSYDPSVLEGLGVVKGSLTTDCIFDHSISSGTIKVALADSDGFVGDGSVAYVKFSVIGAAGSLSPLDIVEVSANEPDDYEALGITANDGIFTVTGTEESRGDCDGDGQISVVDALCALQMAVGKKTEDLVMDIYGDGKVTSLDARGILRVALGLET